MHHTCIMSVQCESNHSISYSGVNAPTITSLQLIVPGKLRVEWSSPVGGAPVISYTIHYSRSDGSSGTEVAPAGSTTNDIPFDLCDNVIYTVTVEARSDQLSGESESMKGGGRFISLFVIGCVH